MRVLLSVGCDQYIHTTRLNGAVYDAEQIFSALVGTKEHQYDPRHSKLLRSPTANDFRKLISEALYETTDVTVVTIFFAGHATVNDETLYLALEDAHPNRIPATAIGFPEILRSTAGARPKQANFVLDACNTGGLGFDIGAILKRTIVGNSDSMGISFLASAAADQLAGETKAGGVFTGEFVKVIRGDVFVQNSKPFLGLAEIAQQMQADSNLVDQTISYWSLNLQGPNLFAKNPRYSGPAHVTDQIVSQLQHRQISTHRHAGDFKAALARITNGIDEPKFSEIAQNTFSKIEEGQRASLIQGLAEGLRSELAGAKDQFLEARIYCVLVGLLGLCESTQRKPASFEIIRWLVDADRRALSTLRDAMASDRNALIVDILSDLYELPIRVSDILGQCALFFFGQRNTSSNDLTLIEDIIRGVLQRYGNSILALSDDQATGYLLCLEMCRRNRWTEFSEEIIGRLYHDLHRNFARCGSYFLDAESRFYLLKERYNFSFSTTPDIYNSPSDLTTVILSFAALCFLDEAVDLSLIEIDHTNINYFVPEGFDQFGLKGSMDGTNYTLALGHDFWRCIDLRRILLNDILPKFRIISSAMSWEDQYCSLAGSLALRDRLPWHIVGLEKS